MTREPDVSDVAVALRDSIGLLLRQMRQQQPDGAFTLPESAAMTRLNRGGPTTSSALAKLAVVVAAIAYLAARQHAEATS